jgi:tetratricopeptide (TPR) repeat protein
MLHNQENPAVARRFLQLSQDAKRSNEQRTSGASVLSMIDAEQGRFSAAVDRLRPLTLPTKLRTYAAYANTPLSRIPRAQLASMRAEVLAMDSVAQDSTPTAQVGPYARLFRAAVLSCRMNDLGAAAQYAQRLRTLAAPEYWKASLAMLADEIDAQIDLENNRPQEALRKLERHRIILAADLGADFSWGGSYAIWRAEALFRAQRYEEAAQWFENLDGGIVGDIPHVSYILLRRAQIADARNESEKARDLYARFLKLWDKPDPELQPVVDQARSRLAALQAKVG